MGRLDAVSGRRRVIQQCTGGAVLLVRYYVIDTRWFAVYVHHLQSSDEDRALHDHPWSFLTFLISSGYYEWVPVTGGEARRWRRQFSILWRPAEWQHRLELVKPTWTLVFRLRRRREWGFVTRNGWLHWKAYGREFCD